MLITVATYLLQSVRQVCPAIYSHCRHLDGQLSCRPPPLTMKLPLTL